MTKTAKLYRMVMDKHVCPYGTKSKWLLEKESYRVEDHHLTTREETDAFKDKHGVDTTPQTFIDGERVGGSENVLFIRPEDAFTVLVDDRIGNDHQLAVLLVVAAPYHRGL